MHARMRRLAALAAAAAAAVSTTAIPAATGAEVAAPAMDPRLQQTELERRSSSALLELYALETRLAAAREAAAVAVHRREELEAEYERTAERLERATAAAQRSQSILAERLRTLYETDGPHPLAILLGAATLDEALTGLEGLRFVAEQDLRIVTQTRDARAQLEGARQALRERRAAAAAAATAAVAHEAAAERAHAESLAYVERLAAERRLAAARIAGLQGEAQAARDRARRLTPRPAAEAPGAGGAAPPAVPAETVEAVLTGGETAARSRTLTVVVSGYALAGRTATGIPAGPGVVAVDPAVIPLGTRMTIPGYGDGVAADVGGSIKGNRIDVWFPTRAEALQWGRRTITITLH